MDRRRLLPLATAAALLAAACARPADDTHAGDGAAPAGEIVIGTRADLAGVNELVSGGVQFTNEIHALLFRGLLEEQPDWSEHPPTLEPDLAESWESSPDGDALTFRLRPGARWSDGRPVTAEDVVFTWRAQVDPAIAWAYASSKDRIESVEALDPQTARFHLRWDSPYQLVDINDGRILPSHAWSELPFEQWRSGEPWFRERLVTSGPFRIESWKPGRELVLAPNPHAGTAPLARRVIFRVVPDPAAMVERLLAGDLDFVDGLSPRDAERISNDPRLRLYLTDSRVFEYVAWNQRRPPFDDLEVRRALALAVDREEITRALWGETARVGAGPIPAGVWARDPELRPWPYDPEEARRILARRGFRDADGDGTLELDGRSFSFELATNSGNRLRADAAALVRDQLRRVGIDARLRTLEIQTLFDRARAGDFDALMGGWAIDTTLDFRPYFHSEATGGDGWNFIGYSNPEVDRILDDVRKIGDLATARPELIRFQRILHEEQPYLFLCEPRRISAADRDIEGIEITALSALGGLPRWFRRSGG